MHSIVENRRDIPGLISNLTGDRVCDLVQTGHRWPGHDGARRFYAEMLEAFPDIHSELRNIVIGPQGAFEEAHVTATHAKPWLDVLCPTNRPIEFGVLILFPWDAHRKKFTGQRVWFNVPPSLSS